MNASLPDSCDKAKGGLREATEDPQELLKTVV